MRLLNVSPIAINSNGNKLTSLLSPVAGSDGKSTGTTGATTGLTIGGVITRGVTTGGVTIGGVTTGGVTTGGFTTGGVTGGFGSGLSIVLVSGISVLMFVLGFNSFTFQCF